MRRRVSPDHSGFLARTADDALLTAIDSCPCTERRKAEEKAELDAFLATQREKLLTTPPPDSTSLDEEDDDVDYSFAHLRIGGKGKMAPPAGMRLEGMGRGRAKVQDEKDLEELRKMQDEARHMQAVRGSLRSLSLFPVLLLTVPSQTSRIASLAAHRGQDRPRQPLLRDDQNPAYSQQRRVKTFSTLCFDNARRHCEPLRVTSTRRVFLAFRT